MDLLTQGILGASTAQAGAKPAEIRLASVTGFLAGLTPDLDTFIRSSENPLLVLEYHRHFTHSLLFIPFGALLTSGIIWIIFRNKYSFKTLYWYALLGICLASLLDACTSYGTSLLWPVMDTRIAWNLIAIVDPVFSLVLLIPLVIGIKKKSILYPKVGLALAAIYMMLAWVQSQRANDIAIDLIAERNHLIEKRIIKPTMGNIVLWKSIYVSDGMVYTDAIRAGFSNNNRVYPGTNLPLLDLEAGNPFPENSQASIDLQQFSKISDHWLVIHPARPNMAGDVRYSMLPISIEPLWGVDLNVNDPEDHLELITNRKFTKSIRGQFINMLLGSDLDH